MSHLGLPPRIELDGALELLRCPDFRAGWPADAIRVVYDSSVWELPSGHRERAKAWELANPNERSDPKVALRELHVDAEHRLHCQLQATEWRQVRPLHEGPRLEESELLRHQKNGCSLLLPNIGVVHVVASTRDKWLLSYRRSEQAHYHPAAWSSTYEEGLAPEDVVGDTVFQRAARRGLMEEVTEEWGAVGLEAFRLVSFIWERPLGNLAAVVVVDLPFSKEELPTHLSSDELDAGSVLVTPIARLREMLTDRPPTEPSRNPWHPTSRYRLLAAIAHFFGEDAAAKTLREVAAQGHGA
jgi:hypothetical protein